MTRRHRHRSRRRRGSAPEARAADDGLSPNPRQLDRLAPEVAARASRAGLRPPPELVVESPERMAERRARDLRDGVKPADRRGLLYVVIGVFVAVVVIGILAFIDARASMP